MADDRGLLVGRLGQPCPVYVEHAGAEMFAPSQEQMIKGASGIVVEDPNQAAVVVVIKRGAESVEKRIRDTCSYRRTNPWIQGVVDGMWVTDCIHQSKLLGPPDWGGHLYRPALDLEPIITEDEADAATFSAFDRPIYEPDHEEDTEELDSMQLDSVPAAGASGSNPQNNTSEESSRGVTSTSAGDVPVPPSDGVTTQGRRKRSSKNKGLQKPKDSFQEAWIKVEKIVEDPKKKGWFGTFSTDDVLELIDGLCELGATTDPEPALSWWEGFTKRHPPDPADSRLQVRRRNVDSWRELYRDRKGMINKCVNKLLIARSASGSDSLRPLQGHSASRTSRYESRSHSGRRPLYQDYVESYEQSIRTETSPEFSDDERQPISSTAEPTVQPRERGRPPQRAANNQEGGLPQTPQQGEKTGTVALPKRVRIRLANETQAPTVAPERPFTVVTDDESQWIYQAVKLFVACSDSALLNQNRTFPPRCKGPFGAFMREQFCASLTMDESTWIKWGQDNWDVISTGAVALKGKAPSGGNDVRKRLSDRNEAHTAVDYDEVADFIGKQIQARKLPEGEVVAVMMQDFVWKAFVAVYLTDRNWKEWQDYYRERADDINRTALVRLKPEEPSVAQVAAEMEQLLASGGYDSPPPNSVLKRSLEEPSDERRPKHPRL